MKKCKTNNGFSLAELLIVVAIIGILVAVSIPIFTAQLNKAKTATDIANARALYGKLVVDYMDDGHSDDVPNPMTLNGKGIVTVGQDQYIFSDQLQTLQITMPTSDENATIIDVVTGGVEYRFPGNTGGRPSTNP